MSQSDNADGHGRVPDPTGNGSAGGAQLTPAAELALLALPQAMRDVGAELLRLARHLASGHAVAVVRAVQEGQDPPSFEEGEKLLAFALKKLGSRAPASPRRFRRQPCELNIAWTLPNMGSGSNTVLSAGQLTNKATASSRRNILDGQQNVLEL
ncbi:MAG: hypothetical protein ACYSUI_00570 [Planctomycetota bacterium]|jgi:hypothetical protein